MHRRLVDRPILAFRVHLAPSIAHRGHRTDPFAPRPNHRERCKYHVKENEREHEGIALLDLRQLLNGFRQGMPIYPIWRLSILSGALVIHYSKKQGTDLTELQLILKKMAKWIFDDL